jgi:predicted nucleic acid-binding protein
MTNLVDSSLWIDYFRRQTPLAVKIQIDQIVNNPDIVTCEPILFELLRAASRADSARIEEYFATIPVLPAPEALWTDARILGQKCSNSGFLPRALDLLIAQIGLHHSATITTFDDHFRRIGAVCPLKLDLLIRRTP